MVISEEKVVPDDWQVTPSIFASFVIMPPLIVMCDEPFICMPLPPKAKLASTLLIETLLIVISDELNKPTIAGTLSRPGGNTKPVTTKLLPLPREQFIR